MKKKNTRKNNKYKPCRIVIERKYVGTTKMEDVFKQLAEEEIKNKAEKYIITT